MTRKEHDLLEKVNSYFEDQKRINKRRTVALEAIRMDVEAILKNELYLSQLCGEWIHLGGDEWCCSCCGEVVTTEGSWEHPRELSMNYCQYCGACLDEEGEESES